MSYFFLNNSDIKIVQFYFVAQAQAIRQYIPAIILKQYVNPCKHIQNQYFKKHNKSETDCRLWTFSRETLTKKTPKR